MAGVARAHIAGINARLLMWTVINVANRVTKSTCHSKAVGEVSEEVDNLYLGTVYADVNNIDTQPWKTNV